MLFTVEELSPWLGLSRFELLVQTLCLLLFTIFLTVRIELNASEFTATDIWWIFSPLFAANVVNAYFCVIVFIRTCLERTFKVAVLRAIWSGLVIGILMTFEYLVCLKLLSEKNLDTSEVVSPILLLLQVLAVRACQTQWDFCLKLEAGGVAMAEESFLEVSKLFLYSPIRVGVLFL